MRAKIQNALSSRGIAASGESTAAKQPPTWSPPGRTNMTDSQPVDETVRRGRSRRDIYRPRSSHVRVRMSDAARGSQVRVTFVFKTSEMFEHEHIQEAALFWLACTQRYLQQTLH